MDLLTNGMKGWMSLGLLFAWAWAAPAQVVINEVLADNQTALENGPDFPDYIELYNRGESAVNLGGMSLSDENNMPKKYVFPANTMLAAKAYLVVFADDNTNSPGLHTRFGLSANGEVLALYSAAPALLDAVNFGLQLPDRSIGRVPDGTGAWTLTSPTAGDVNEGIVLGGPGQLRINEWMALTTDSTGDVQDDWVEIYNATNRPVLMGGLFLSDSSTNHMLRALSFIEALGFIQFKADDNAGSGADHLPFKLSSSNGETLRIYDRNGFTVLEQISFLGGQQDNVAQGRLPDGAPPPFQNFPDPRDSPGESNSLLITNVWINEVLTHTDPPYQDALELHNPTATPVSISRWWISDDPSDPFRYRVPVGTTIPAFSFKVFYAKDFDPTGSGIPPAFTFNSFEGDEVNLYATDANGDLSGHVLRESFGASFNGVSFGRVRISDGKDFVPMTQLSFGRQPPDFVLGTGQANPLPRVGPVVISEIMYHPPDIIQGTNHLDNSLDEYIELRSITNGVVRLFDPAFPTNTWRIKEGISYRFPQGIMMQPGQTILLVNFDPETNLVQRAAFTARYAVADETPIFGPYQGKLSNGGEGIELVRPDTPQGPGPSAGFVPYVTAERVRYNDRNHWPTAPDGGGLALQRLINESYGNEATNWIAALPTPGREAIQIASAGYLEGSFWLRFQAGPGVSYSVLYSTNLQSGPWLELQEISPGTQTRMVEVSDDQAGVLGMRFYQLVSPAR